MRPILPFVVLVVVTLVLLGLAARELSRIPSTTSTPNAAAKIVWFVLEGDTATLPALDKGTMLIQKLPRVTAAAITQMELLISAIGDVSQTTYRLELYDAKNEQLFSTVLEASKVASNSYNRVVVKDFPRPVRDERLSLVLYSENATQGGALTAYYTRSHPEGAFFLVPYDGQTSVPQMLEGLRTNQEKKRFRGSLNLNIFGHAHE